MQAQKSECVEGQIESNSLRLAVVIIDIYKFSQAIPADESRQLFDKLSARILICIPGSWAGRSMLTWLAVEKQLFESAH